MTIAPFSFREFGTSDVEFISSAKARAFLPTGRKKEEASPPPPPPPIFSEEELKTAERDSYQKGFLSGIVEGKQQAESTQAQIDRDLGKAVEDFAQHLAPLFSVYREMLAQQAKMLPQLAHGIAKKVAGEALAQNAYANIEEICLRCVNAMLHEPKLAITVHESMAKTLEEKIAAAAKTLQVAGEITVTGDASIAPANCRIEWKNGAMVRDTGTLWQQVEQVMGSMATSAGREASEACDQIEPLVVPPPAASGENS